MTDIPRGAVARTADWLACRSGFAGRTALGLGKRVTGMAADVISAEVQQRTAEQLFSVLGQLKGGAMKFGQALSVFEAALPEELAGPYREALTKLQEAAPPLPAASVHKVLPEQLGRGLAGPVRRVRRHPGRGGQHRPGAPRRIWDRTAATVAVKVQYPGAGEALLVRPQPAGPAGRAVQGHPARPGRQAALVQELRDRITEELDYELEADVAARVRRRVRRRPGDLRAAVLAASPRVLVTEWIEGTPLATIIAGGHRRGARRRRAADGAAALLRARPGRSCCTPTRTRATSGCCPTAGSA